MNDILDHDSFQIKKDESKINKITSTSRYLVCGYMTAQLAKIVYNKIVTTSFSNKGILFFGGLFMGFIIYAIWIYYNVKQAKEEKKQKFVLPIFNKPFILLFLFYNFYQIVIYSQQIILNFQAVNIEINSLTLLVLIALLSIISWREVIYYKRHSLN